VSKSKTKGYGFEREVAYSLIEGGYKVKRTGNDNIAGIDVIAKDLDTGAFLIECKRYKGFSWNQLVGMLNKTLEFALDLKGVPILVFKANQQPALVMYVLRGVYTVVQFEDFFNTPFLKRPKGHTFLKEEDG